MRDLPAGAGVDPVAGTELRCGHGATPIPGDRWADGKLLGNATDSCTGATQRPLASPHWHSVPLGWNRAYSGVRFWRWWVSQGNWPSGSHDLMYPPRSAGGGFAFRSALALRMAVAR